MIQLTEVAKYGDKIRENPMLINPAYIAAVSVKEIQLSDVPIIGMPNDMVVSAIELTDGGTIFYVKETLDEITDKISG